MQTALFASRFCKDVPALRHQCSQAYVCGLLHDIGRFVQFEGAPADLTSVDEKHWMGPEELVDLERSTLGYDHALLGWHACRKWSLPEPIGEVVRHHHADLSDTVHEHADLIRLVQWADALSMALLLDPGIADLPAESLIQHLAREHAEIGPGHSADEKARWYRWVPDLRDKSMQLAREMNLLR